MTVSPETVHLLAVGVQQSLTVLGWLADGTLEDITAGYGTVYMSSAPAVATVSPKGLITAVAPGTATITVSHWVLRTSVQVTVEPPLFDYPNTVLILTDDQRWDTLWAMPIVQKALVERGVLFTNAFVTTPLCCPDRASLLSGGYYAHHTGVLTNDAPNGGAANFQDTDTLATRLQQVGYQTALIGKYLNGYWKLAPYIPPGWSHFVARTKGESWFDYELVARMDLNRLYFIYFP